MVDIVLKKLYNHSQIVEYGGFKVSKKNVWIKVLSLATLVLMGGVGATGSVFAESLESHYEISSKVSTRKFHVENPWELAICVNKAHAGETIVLEKDMVLESELNIKSSVCIDLNGHILSVKGERAGIVVGCSKFERNEQLFKHIPGHYKIKPVVKTVLVPARRAITQKGKKVYIPASWQTINTTEKVWIPDKYEPYLKPLYKYDDDLDVLIKNGEIKKSPGDNGKDGEKNSDCCNGDSGKTPKAPVEILSGTLRLSKIKVNGGRGGNGGNGGYEKLIHFIFGGGDGGNGGNGAKGGYAVYIRRKECKLIKDKRTELKAGNPGKGGLGGKPNPNYWVYSGKAGSNGKDGLESTPCNI